MKTKNTMRFKIIRDCYTYSSPYEIYHFKLTQDDKCINFCIVLKNKNELVDYWGELNFNIEMLKENLFFNSFARSIVFRKDIFDTNQDDLGDCYVDINFEVFTGTNFEYGILNE